jgi:hypothetical protein
LPERGAVLRTRDLFFRAKLEAILRAAGLIPKRNGPAELALVELGDEGDLDQIRALVAEGLPVVAFGSHVRAELLRAAREAGAEAVPNSRVEETVRRMIGEGGRGKGEG